MLDNQQTAIVHDRDDRIVHAPGIPIRVPVCVVGRISADEINVVTINYPQLYLRFYPVTTDIASFACTSSAEDYDHSALLADVLKADFPRRVPIHQIIHHRVEVP